MATDDTPDQPVNPRAERAAPPPRNQSSPVNQAARAVDTIREITRTVDGYEKPSELYGVLIQLTHLTDHAGQIIDQANKWLRAQSRAGQVVATADGGDVDATIQALLAAAVAGRTFSAAIDDAAGHVGHLISEDAPTTG
jgi:hypothetical protein